MAHSYDTAEIVVIVFFVGLILFCIGGLIRAIYKAISTKNEREELQRRQEQAMRDKQKQEREAIEMYDKAISSRKEESVSSDDETTDDWDNKIKQLKELLDCGAITDEEYQQLKNKYLGL